MRPATAALAVLIAAIVACLLVPARSDPVTSPPRSGDAPRRVRAVEPGAEEEEEADDEESDSEKAAEPDAPEEPEPPRRVIRIVDGRGDPVPGVAVGVGGEFTRSTDAAGETSFQALGESSCVKFFDGAVRREVVLVEPFTEVVATSLPSLEVSAVDSRTGVALDPVRCRLRRGEGDKVEFWTGRDLPTLAVAEDGDASFTLEIDAPAGHGGYASIPWIGKLATRTRTVRFVVPLFDTTERTILTKFRGGGPARGAVVSAIHAQYVRPVLEFVGTASISYSAGPSGADGLIRVTGIPRIPFTRFDVELSWRADAEGTSGGLGATIVGLDPCAEPPAEPFVAELSNAGWYRGPCGSGMG